MKHNIEVGEHGKVAVPEAVVAAVPSSFWKEVDCSVTRTSIGGEWTLRAGSSVGVAHIQMGSGEVTVQIKPKLHTADVFLLADYAYEQRHDPLKLLDYDDVGLEAVLRDPTACLLVWHARSIRRFAARWLRRDYQTRRQVLEGKVKGKILVSRYVVDHLSIGDAGRIPCRVQERTQDTPNNRILKAGLRYIALISHTLQVPAAKRAVLREVKATLPHFAHVADIGVSPSDIRAISIRGSQRHYSAVLNATIALLRNRLMGDRAASATATSSFMWRMPLLFQEAVRGIIRSTPGLMLVDQPHQSGNARIYDADGRRLTSSKVDPDLVMLAPGGRTLLLDTKYKDALAPGPLSSDDDEVTRVGKRNRIKVSRSDIYQVVAYREHEKWPNATAGLLYPVTLSSGEPLPAPMEVRGFAEPILLVFIDIGLGAAQNVAAFVETVHHINRKADVAETTVTTY